MSQGSGGQAEVQKKIIDTVGQICAYFGSRLTFGAFGFAKDSGTMFELMKKMVEEAKNCGSKGVFSSGLDTQLLRKALFSMATSLTSTRVALSTMAAAGEGHVSKKVMRTDLV